MEILKSSYFRLCKHLCRINVTSEIVLAHVFYCKTVMWVNGVTPFKQKPIEYEEITFTWKFYNFAIF